MFKTPQTDLNMVLEEQWQQTYGRRDSPIAKEWTFVHILLTFDSILCSLWLFHLYRRTVKVACPNTHPSTTVAEVSQVYTKEISTELCRQHLNEKWGLLLFWRKKKTSRGSNLRNSVGLNQKISGSIKPRTKNPMKCFTVGD